MKIIINLYVELLELEGCTKENGTLHLYHTTTVNLNMDTESETFKSTATIDLILTPDGKIRSVSKIQTKLNVESSLKRARIGYDGRPATQVQLDETSERYELKGVYSIHSFTHGIRSRKRNREEMKEVEIEGLMDNNIDDNTKQYGISGEEGRPHYSSPLLFSFARNLNNEITNYFRENDITDLDMLKYADIMDTSKFKTKAQDRKIIKVKNDTILQDFKNVGEIEVF